MRVSSIALPGMYADDQCSESTPTNLVQLKNTIACGWTGEVPLVGRSVQRLLQAVAKPFVSTFMRRTGRQFFMQDGPNGQSPLLVSPQRHLSVPKSQTNP